MALIQPPDHRLSRRALLRRSVLASGGLVAAAALVGRALAQNAPAAITSDRMRPRLPYGVQTGDLAGDRAIIWGRADRPARMMVEWATTEAFDDVQVWRAAPRRSRTPTSPPRWILPACRSAREIFYRVAHGRSRRPRACERAGGRQLAGRRRRRSRDLRFVWSADTAGQGWGINPDWGGMRIYETMRQVEPAFFIHSGDTIYADGPIPAEVALPDGGVWKNLTTEAKSKVAETLAEFRGDYAYNLMDENLRRFNAAVPMLAQWDDHEVVDNWYWEKRLDADGRYREKSVALLAAPRPARFHRIHAGGPAPARAAPHLWELSLRSGARGVPDRHAFLSRPEYRWPRDRGRARDQDPRGRADAPAQAGAAGVGGHLEGDRVRHADRTDRLGRFPRATGAEAVAQGDDGPPLGRELEIAGLLGFIHDNDIANVVWLTADVHYTAAHYYDPSRAQFQEFTPFWEFVSGPLNAGTFGPSRLDATFGPQVVFQKAPPAGQFNLPPSAGLQFFGQVDIDGRTEVMTVRLKDLAGATLFTQELEPERA